MIPIAIDVRDLVQEFSLSREQVDDMMSFTVKGITARFASLWEQEAKKGLKSTRKTYVRSLYVGEEGRFKGIVILRGMLPNMVEQGASPFDMKEGFAKSSKRKINGLNWYLTIPFRWATPGALGESEVFASKMPSEIYMVARGLQGTTSQSGLGIVRSGSQVRLKDIPSPFDIPKVRSKVVGANRIFEEYKNKTSVYAGIGKTTKTYEQTSQNSYVSFRRVSNNSDSLAFIHTGIQAKNFADKALAKLDIPREADMAIDNYLSGLGL